MDDQQQRGMMGAGSAGDLASSLSAPVGMEQQQAQRQQQTFQQLMVMQKSGLSSSSHGTHSGHSSLSVGQNFGAHQSQQHGSMQQDMQGMQDAMGQQGRYRHASSKALPVVTWYCKCTRAITFGNSWAAPAAAGWAGRALVLGM